VSYEGYGEIVSDEGSKRIKKFNYKDADKGERKNDW